MPEEEEKKEVKLTDKEELFVAWYPIYLNGAKAARKAGYSKNSAAEIAYENLRKPHIKAKIDKRLQERTMSADEATARLTSMARGSIGDYLEVNEDGEIIITIKKGDESQDHALIKKIKQTKRSIKIEGQPDMVDTTTELELHDAKDAIAKILQVHGKLGNRVEVNNNIENKIKTYRLLDEEDDE